MNTTEIFPILIAFEKKDKYLWIEAAFLKKMCYDKLVERERERSL